jgi:hypothetical protein
MLHLTKIMYSSSRQGVSSVLCKILKDQQMEPGVIAYPVTPALGGAKAKKITNLRSTWAT